MQQMNQGEWVADMDQVLTLNLNSMSGDQLSLIQDAIRLAQPDLERKFAPPLVIAPILIVDVLAAAIAFLLREGQMVPTRLEIKVPGLESNTATSPEVMIVKGVGINEALTIPVGSGVTVTTSDCTTLEPAPGPACRTDYVPFNICTEKPKLGCPAGPIYTPTYLMVEPTGMNFAASLASADDVLESAISSLDAEGADTKASQLTALPPFIEKVTADTIEKQLNPMTTHCSVVTDVQNSYTCRCDAGTRTEVPLTSPGQVCGTTFAPYNCITP